MRAAIVLMLCACGAPSRAPSDAGAPDAADGGPTCSAGQSPRSGSCVPDCGDPLAPPCANGDVCNFASGACVAPASGGVLGGSPQPCGTGQCMPGTECNLAGHC